LSPIGISSRGLQKKPVYRILILRPMRPSTRQTSGMNHCTEVLMNRRVRRQIIIAVGILAGFVVLMTILSQVA